MEEKKCNKGFFKKDINEIVCNADKSITNFNCSPLCKNIPLKDCLIKQLQLKDKMIELMANLMVDFDVCSANEDVDCKDNINCEQCLISYYKQQALAELEGKQ